MDGYWRIPGRKTVRRHNFADVQENGALNSGKQKFSIITAAGEKIIREDEYRIFKEEKSNY